MNANRIAFSVFELSASPQGQLISFEPESSLASRISQLGSRRGVCWTDGGDLVLLFDDLALSFTGAAPLCGAWTRTGLPTYLCAFSPDFLGGAMAFAIDWNALSA